ncbi:MAG: NAD(P)-dependent oxidoreductase [Pseudomonadota bacterium]
MTLLITGGGGFVMSNLALMWLERHPGARVVVLDAGPKDAALERFWAPVAERLTYIRGSVLDAGLLTEIATTHAPERILHAATVTLFAPETAEGRQIANPETEVPDQVLEVNIMGTVRLLELARTLPGLKCFINLSSGGVYNDYGPEPPGPMPEDGWVDPPEFYGISKYASETIARHYGRQFGFEVCSARLSGVYGPMDRWRPSRAYDCPPKAILHRALAGETIRINATEGVGDHIHAQDVARAMIALLEKETPFEHSVYNVAQGEAVTLGHLLALCAEIVPGLSWEIAPPAACHIVADPRFLGGRWGAYDTTRIRRETGWAPMALPEALADYAGFIRRFGPTP